MSFDKNISMLKLAIELLGDLSEKLIFVGGATTCLYVEPSIADELRPTEDVDCVIEASSLLNYNKVEKILREKGFSNDTRRNAPICRFLYKDILTLDVMPDDDRVLGFSNSWYKAGIKNKITIKIEDKLINIFSFPYFLASKFEAFENRGKNDPRLSSDLEDIVIVLDGLKNLELKNMDSDITSYLSAKATDCLNERNTIEAIEGFLSSEGKVLRVRKRFKSIAELKE
jgi:hypothetical protein